MGQTIGRAPLPKGSIRFLNLPKSCVYDLWESFNDIAEGFGLTIEEFQEIVKSGLMEHLNVTERQLNLDTDHIFRAFDDDQNNLVDSLEFISSFALLSGMTPEEKIRFIFAMYDFDESGVLTLDEMVLALRSTLSGLSKLSRIDPPAENEVEAIVILAFDAIKSAENPKDPLDFQGIEREAFVLFCLSTPEVMAWIEYFDDLEEYELESSKFVMVLDDVVPPTMKRTLMHQASMNATFGGPEHLVFEKKGDYASVTTRKSWHNVIPLLAPTKPPDLQQSLPKTSMTLEWVYGCNLHSASQCVYYSAKGGIIFPAGSVCVVQEVMNHEQKYFNEHSDLVTCLKVYTTSDGDTVVASGECGLRPSIFVWDGETRKVLSHMRGFHRNGILQLDFSPGRTKLVSVGMDTYHCVAVHDWRSRQLLWASRTSNDAVCDVRFLSDEVIASCGLNHVTFWREEKRGKLSVYKRYRGQFGTSAKPETLCCVGMVDKTVFTGSVSGMLHVWEGRTLVQSVKGHTAAINACFIVEHEDGDKGLVTACAAGKIQVWNSKLEIGATFNAISLGAIESCITCVCYDVVASKLLLGFKTCEIFEMDATDGRNVHHSSVVAGHFAPRVCGISTHPLQVNIFCSVGDDRTVRIFDAASHKQLRVTTLDTIGYCCEISRDGQWVLVGLGSGVDGQEERKEGAFIVLSQEDLTLLHEARDSKSAISDCKFSANGERFALASLDGSIYVYGTKKFSAKSKCQGHSGAVQHIDFSSNSSYIMSNCSKGELLFWDVETGELQVPKSIKSVQWETNSCVNSYSTQGLWGPFDDGVAFHASCKSNSLELLVAVDNFGKVRAFQYPCLGNFDERTSPPFLQRIGHSRGIRNCRFSCDDSYVITCGETDGCVFQWRVASTEQQSYEDMKKFDVINDANAAEMRFEGKLLLKPEAHENMMNSRNNAVCNLEEGLDDDAPLMPWQKAIVAPSRVPVEDNTEPADHLELEFVYGFTTDISRRLLQYSPKREIAFVTASLAVTMNQKTRKQSFYNTHTSKITSMAVNKVHSVIATGDQAELPSVFVWNSESMETVAVLRGYHRRAINHLSFSADGVLLVTVGHDNFHSVAVYDWRNQVVVANSMSFVNKSLWIDFNPNGNGLVQCGNQIVRFWDLDGRNLTFADAIFGNRAKLQAYLCSGWIGSNAVVGTADGSIYRFLGNKLESIVQGHSGPVNCMSTVSDGVCTGGSDGFVKIWTRFLECRLVIEMKNLRSISSIVICVDWDFDLNQILIGTSNAEVFEVNAGDGENLHHHPLLEGHGGEELWGLSVNPLKDEFCTVGDDALLRVWNNFDHSCISTVALEMPARCCAYSPDGKCLAIGFGCPKKLSNRQFDGKWVVLDTDDYQVSHEARDSTKWLTEIKYSPNGEFIAIGSYDNKIYVYGVNAGYALNAVVSQHQSFITSIDFSEDSQWMQSNCGGFELHFFEADTGLYIPAATKLRDVVWSTQNCSMAWPVQGIWPPQRDGTEITAIDCNLYRAEDGTVVAAGDNFGRIRVFRYPCTSSFAVSKIYWATSSPITRMRFASGDAYLITTCGSDKTIMQWAHRRDREEDIAFETMERRGKVEEEEDDIATFFGFSATTNSADAPQNELQKLVSTRPWLASIVAPSDAEGFDAMKTLHTDFHLSHIIGLQTRITRHSVRFTNGSDILYPVSKYVCVYNKKLNKQIFYDAHQNELSCVAVSADGLVAASVEKTFRTQIHIWDSSTCGQLCLLPSFHRQGVSYMQFSKNRKCLVSVGQDQDNSLALWLSPSGDWTDARLLATAKGDVNPMLYCSFYMGNGNGDGFILGSGGRFHQKFWKIRGKCLDPYYAEYEKRHKLGTLLCGNAVRNKFVSGSTTGHLYVWDGRKLERMIRAHELGVTCIWSQSDSVLTASKDGTIKLWTADFEHIRNFTLFDADVPPVLPSIRSLDAIMLQKSNGEHVNKIMVTTAASEIYEISASSGSLCLMQESHFEGELCGLAVHPTDPDLFATTGDDKTIRIWSISARRLLRKALIDCTTRCVSWSADGKVLIVGMGGAHDGKRQRKDGAFLMIDALTLKPMFEGRDSRHWISDIKFSPDGKSFAMSSMDHKIYIYNAETYRLKGTCDRHNSSVRGFDFSRDSMYLQSDSADFEHLYFEAEDGEYFSAGSQLRDIKWYDWTCIYGWPVQGIWPKLDEVDKSNSSSDPTTTHRSPKKDLLVTGDQSGFIKICRYPSLSKDAPSTRRSGHYCEVASVKFSCDGRFVISIGKKDRAIMIWKVVRDGGLITGTTLQLENDEEI